MPDMKIQADAVTSSEAALSPCVRLFVELLIEECDSGLGKFKTSSPQEKCLLPFAPVALHPGTGDIANTYKSKTETFD